MTKHNAANERIKRKYFAYLKEAERHSEPTVDASAKALNRFEVYTKHRDFRMFHFEQAIAFKKHLAEQKGQQFREKLSKATLYATLTQVKRFFQWLAWQPGYKSRFQYCDAEYFNLSDKDTRIATAQRETKSANIGAGKARYQYDAGRHSDREPEPRPYRIHDPYRRAGPRDRFDEAKAC